MNKKMMTYITSLVLIITFFGILFISKSYLVTLTTGKLITPQIIKIYIININQC
jgi:hypothetical protein